MNKIILSFITLISFFSLSHGFEANVKFGYDFFRYSHGNIEPDLDHINYERGFVVGVEILPFTFKDERIKLGVGLEYNFGEKEVEYIRTGNTHGGKKQNNLIPNVVYLGSTMVPLYATAKFTYYRHKNIDLNLYTFARFGYAFANETKKVDYNYRIKNVEIINRSGVYFGFGFGLDHKYFLIEILYDGRYKDKYNRSYSIAEMSHYLIPNGYYNLKDFHHKIGLRLGLQLGTQHFKKAKIEPKIVEKIVEKKVEVPKLIEKKITNKIIIKNFDISAQALFEFNKYKLEDLKEGGKHQIEEKVKELLKSGFEITGINVIGHTDRLGKDDYNYKLGLDRANTIAEYLKELGIKVEIKSSSKGKTEPKVHCNNIKSTSKLKECLQPNRRVELQFIGFETEQKVEEVVETSK